jgi:hypothetical protein
MAVLRMRTKLMMRLLPRLLTLVLRLDEPARLHKRHWKVQSKLGHRKELQKCHWLAPCHTHCSYSLLAKPLSICLADAKLIHARTFCTYPEVPCR